MQLGYLGDCFGRPSPVPPPWAEDEALVEHDLDMYALEDESVADVLELVRVSDAHADATISALALDTVGTVPWWPAERRHPTLHAVVVHLTIDVARHAGQADILREQLDGSAGLRADNDNLTTQDDGWWREHVERLQRIADARR